MRLTNKHQNIEFLALANRGAAERANRRGPITKKHVF